MSWSLDLATLPVAPATDFVSEYTQFSSAISAVGTPTVVSGINPLGGFQSSERVVGVGVRVDIRHTFCSDLDITLTSPSGTVATLTTDNGGSFDDVFAGTVLSSQEWLTVTDYAYTNLVPVPSLCSEGPKDVFTGELAWGVWTLTVHDDAGGDGGTLDNWILSLELCGADPGVPYCASDNLDPAVFADCPCSNFGAPQHGCASSFNASGATLIGSTVPQYRLIGTGMNPTGNCIFLMGDLTSGGVVFGDGVRCAAGNLVRLRTKALSSGSASFPDTDDTVTLFQRSGSPTGGVERYYTAYYRNAAAAFCPPGTFNASNGYRTTW